MAIGLKSFAVAGLLVQIGSGLLAETVMVFDRNPVQIADMQPLPLHVGGRIQRAGPEIYAHQWPGVYVEAAFHGTALTIRFDDSINEYSLQIDDAAPVPLAQPGTVDIRITGLADADHRVRIDKNTESIDLTGNFGGVYIPLADQPLPVPPRSRQIEFIGDSDMTGYGIRSDNRNCTPEQVRLLSDTQAAYPVLVAKHFDADYQVNAISGRGMVRNYDGFDPAISMQFVYQRVLPSEEIVVADPGWDPQIIYVALGGNDFATALHSGENWTDPAELIADYINSFSRFVAHLHVKNPNATILIAMPYGSIIPEVQTTQFVTDFQSALLVSAGQIGLNRIDFLTLTDAKPEFTACDHHPSLRDQQNRAAWLIGYLEDHPGLWDRP